MYISLGAVICDLRHASKGQKRGRRLLSHHIFSNFRNDEDILVGSAAVHRRGFSQDPLPTPPGRQTRG